MEIKSVRLTPDVIKGVSYRAKMEDVDELLYIPFSILKENNQIDQLVYKLYDLTPEEIQIVEGFNEGK